MWIEDCRYCTRYQRACGRDHSTAPYRLTWTVYGNPQARVFLTEAAALTAYDNLIARSPYGAGRTTHIYGPTGRIL